MPKFGDYADVGAAKVGDAFLAKVAGPLTRRVLAEAAIPADTVAVNAEGERRWDTAADESKVHNGQREISSTVGWTPFAVQEGFVGNAGLATTLAIAVGVGIAIPVFVRGHGVLAGLRIRNAATANLREAEWRLYKQRLNQRNAAEGTAVDEIAGANGTFSFTPAAADNRSSAPSSAQLYIPPGCYWVVIRNTSGSQTFIFGSVGGGAANYFPSNQTKGAVGALGATLDLVTGWTKVYGQVIGVMLEMETLGQSAAW